MMMKSPKLTMEDCERIHKEADLAGKVAANNKIPTPMIVQQRASVLDDNSPVVKQWNVPSGVCGFAWVIIKPGNSRFAKYLKAKGIGRKDEYRGGINYWVHDYNQSMELKEAYAAQYAAVLRSYGIKAYSESKMD